MSLDSAIASLKRLYAEPDPDSDQALVDRIKQATEELRRLGAQARHRGITVYLRQEAQLKYFKPEAIQFDEAFRASYERLS